MCSTEMRMEEYKLCMVDQAEGQIGLLLMKPNRALLNG